MNKTNPSIEEAKTHNLKTWVEYFSEVTRGIKTFEVRKNDRDFKRGDILNLHEYDHKSEKYTGVSASYKVTYILSGGSFGIETGTVVMGIEPVNRAHWREQQEPNQWISVEDKLPGVGYYLILENGEIHTALFDNNFGKRWYAYFGMSESDMSVSFSVEFKKVTHWMPLPKAPKENP